MNWFSNLNAKPRLICTFGIMSALTFAISYLAIASLSEANDRIQGLYQQDMVCAMHVDAIAVARALNGRAIRDALLHINQPAAVEKNKKVSYAQIAAVKTNIEAAQKVASSQEARQLLAFMHDAFPSFDKGQRDVYDRIEAKDFTGAEATLDAATAAAKPLFDAMPRAIEITQKDADEKFQASVGSYHSARTLVLGASFISVALGLVLSLTMAHGFSVPLGKAVQALERLADGDLTASLDVNSKDEVGRMAGALNAAVTKLNQTMQKVADSAANAHASSQHIAAASRSIASSSQQQAASLQETSASLEQITATVRQSAHNARQASDLADGSKDSALLGQDVVSEAITAMAEVNAAAAKIKGIISTMDEIAFQTNLLAVNAAVEAARAGQEGAGFAVVATEVRTLAQRSTAAARQINGLIHDSLRKVEAGSALVARSGETLQGIVSSATRVTEFVGDIALASGQQSSGIEQLNIAVTQMDQTTQSNSSQTEKLSAMAHSLSDQSGHLMKLVGTFTLSPGKGKYSGSLDLSIT